MAENIENNGCSQRDNAEHEGYVKASRSFNRIWKERDSAQPRLLETILYKDNFNRAYKRVKANKGAPGIDGMTIEEALPYLKEHQQEITDRIYRGKYTPSPVRRVEIPKPDGGVRKLGIPTVIDRTLQQAITQQLVPIYEPLFADGSYGYRPNRSAKDAILKVKEYAEQGYTFAVVLDLSKYFDTLNHEILINLLRKNVKDERVVQLIKRYLKSGVMENGVVIDTEEGSPQGGNLSPLLANIYLNEFDQEYLKRGVPCIRYADDIVLLAKSKRASERLLESSTKYLEERLKLTVNREKSRTDAEVIEQCPWATTGRTNGRKPNIITSLELKPEEMEKNNIRFQAKYKEIEENEVRFEEIHCEDAEYLIVAFGSMARIGQKAMEMAREEGIKVGMLRPITLWPFPTKAIAAYADKVKGMLVTELNAGQMIEDVRLAVNGKVNVEHFGRLGGIVPDPDEIVIALKEKLIKK